MWGRDLAEVYDAVYAAASEPSVLEPQVVLLADLAQGGRALEFGIGTGMVALPLRHRGVVVEGIELSEPMAGQLLAKPGGQDLRVARLAGFRLAHRWAGWDRSAFTFDSASHVSVYEKTG